MERGESRAMPQMPCPLVQPLPMRVPKPTNRPPRMRVLIGKPLSGGLVVAAQRCTSIAPRTMPTRKAKRQYRSNVAAVNMPAIMPEMPVIRPENSSIIAALSPISVPPRKLERGVKLSIVLCYSLCIVILMRAYGSTNLIGCKKIINLKAHQVK